MKPSSGFTVRLLLSEEISERAMRKIIGMMIVSVAEILCAVIDSIIENYPDP